jgi:hypothetical protein
MAKLFYFLSIMLFMNAIGQNHTFVFIRVIRGYSLH